MSDSDDEMFRIASLDPPHTGLPMRIWICERGNRRHDFPVRVEGSLSAADLALLARWIVLNADMIAGYWDRTIDTVEALQQLQPLDQPGAVGSTEPTSIARLLRDHPTRHP